MIGAVALIVKLTETLIQRQPVEQIDHVVGGVDRDPDPADLRAGQRVGGVVPELCRQVERDRQRRLAAFEQEAEPFVRLLGRPEPGELAHRPEPAAIHRRIRAAGEGRVPGVPSRDASPGATSSSV